MRVAHGRADADGP
uniref:Uncharacterized protein n=1 Tax=Arundo donax TaxID=35708 RepID=A0A0A9APB9_ARUDO